MCGDSDGDGALDSEEGLVQVTPRGILEFNEFSIFFSNLIEPHQVVSGEMYFYFTTWQRKSLHKGFDNTFLT